MIATTDRELARQIRHLVIGDYVQQGMIFVFRTSASLVVRAHGQQVELRWRPCYHDTAERAIAFISTGDLPPKGAFKRDKLGEDVA